MRKNLFTMFMTIFFILFMNVTIFAKPSVYGDDYAKNALNFYVDEGIINGDENGDIKPYDNIKRAEMFAFINRVFGASHEADISNYTDVKSDAWYKNELEKSVGMKVLVGDGTSLYPERNISRQESFVILARSLNLEPKNSLNSNTLVFHDLDKVAAWARPYIFALINEGIVNGSNGYINPLDNIIRQDFTVTLHKSVNNIIKPGQTLPEVINGNVMFNNVSGEMLKNVTINGNLIIGDGVDGKTLTLEDVNVTGRILIRGGDTLTLKGNTSAGKFNEFKANLPLTVDARQCTVEGNHNVTTKSNNITFLGNFNDITIESDVVVTLKEGTVQNAKINGSNSEFKVQEKGSVKNQSISPGNFNSKFTYDVDIKEETQKEPVDINKGSSSSSSSGNIAGSSSGNSSSSGSSSGSNSGGSSKAITGVGYSGTPSIGQTLTAMVYPRSASATYSWNVGGVVYNGANYTITVADIGKSITVTAYGTNNYTGTKSGTVTSMVYPEVTVHLTNGRQIYPSGTSNSMQVDSSIEIDYIEIDFGTPVQLTDAINSKDISLKVNNEDIIKNVSECISLNQNSIKITMNDDFSLLNKAGTYVLTIPYGIRDNTGASSPSFTVFTLTIKEDSQPINKQEITEVGYSGTVAVGEILTAKVSPENADVTYSWKAGEKESYSGKTYKITVDDIGKPITVMAEGKGNYTGTKKVTVTDGVYPNIVLHFTVGDEKTTEGNSFIMVADSSNSIKYITMDFNTSVQLADDIDNKYISLKIDNEDIIKNAAECILLNESSIKILVNDKLRPLIDPGTYILTLPDGIVGEITENNDILLSPSITFTLILENAVEAISEQEITEVEYSGVVEIGETLTAQVYPESADVIYSWNVGEKIYSGQTYTITVDDIGKPITVMAEGKGNYTGLKSSIITNEVCSDIVTQLIDNSEL